MKISFRNSRIRSMLFSAGMAMIISILFFLTFRETSFTQKKDAAEYAEGISSKLPMQNRSPNISKEVKTYSAKQVQSNLISQIQPEAENYVAEKQIDQNNKKTSTGNLYGEIIRKAYKEKKVEDRIETVKMYLTNPNLTEEDLEKLYIQLAKWLIQVKDYDAALSISDELESHWVDNKTWLQDLEIWRADVDFVRGNRESAIVKLSEIIALPLPEDPAEYGQVHNILFIAPSWLASYYERDNNVDAAIQLLWKNLNRTIEWESSHPEALPLGGAIINNLNSINSYELQQGRISPEEARKRLDDMVKRLNMIRPEYSSNWSYLGRSVGIGYGIIDSHKNKTNEGSDNNM